MANIRIKDLANTASSTASDDFIGIDGATNGTRKLNAYSPSFGGNATVAGTLTVSGAAGITGSDLTLGTSGPSVKSTLSARAPRQGLVFDGVSGALASATVAALGTSPYTYEVICNPSSFALQMSLVDTQNGILIYVTQTTGLVTIYDRVGAAQIYQASTALAVGKTNHIVYSRASGFYLNGVALSTSITDGSNYTGTALKIGADYLGGSPFTGFISARVYNRALSAAEVVALYEAGAPASADYPATAAGTTINSSAWVNNNYSTFSSANGATLSATYSGSGTQYAYAAPTFVSEYGNVIRFYYDLTLTSGQVPYVILTQIGVKSCSATANLTAGSGNYVDLVVNDPSSATTIAINNTAASSWSIANARLTPLGLLLAPDAAQAGGGSVWYDTSGNAANITLPASGVSWNVPTSGKINNAFAITNTTASTTTSTGALVVGNGSSGGLGVGGQITAGGNIVSQGTAILIGNGTDNSAALYATGGPVKFFANATEAGRFATAGNLLIGTTTDSSNGKLQLTTHTTSAGGIGFGTDTSLYRGAGGNLCLNDTGTNAAFSLCNGGTKRADFYAQGSTSALIIGPVTAGWSTVLMSGAGTTALTITSAQQVQVNATTASTSTSTGALVVSGGVGVAGAINAGTLGLNGSTSGAVLNVKETAGVATAVSLTNRNSTQTWSVAVDAAAVDDKLLAFISGGSVIASLNPTDQSATFAGSVKTAAPAGGTAANWKLGTVATVSPTSPNRTIEVDIGGTIYYIHAKTTNN